MYKILSVFIIWFIIDSNGFTNKKPRPRNGEPCTWEGVTGNCVDYWTCVTNAIDSINGIFPPVCSRKGNVVKACCTSCYVVTNISSTVIIEGHTFEKNGKKSHEKCLEYIKLNKYLYHCYGGVYGVGSIFKTYDKEGGCYKYGMKGSLGIGGQDARRAEYPHMALLGFGEDRESAQWLCGGSIISEWYILTAGHCRSSHIGDAQFVAMGILKRSDPPSLWQVYRVDTFIPHPEYRPPSKYHDIALIKTDKRIEFSDAVLPACLPKGDETEEDMETAFATGWGALGHRGGLADVLQKVPVTRFTSQQCSEQYGPHRHLKQGFQNTTQMCYGDSNVGRDTCAGDSGGPLQIDTLSTCPQIVIGVISSGHPCGFVGTAGLYTRVTYYQPWIEGIVWP